MRNKVVISLFIVFVSVFVIANSNSFSSSEVVECYKYADESSCANFSQDCIWKSSMSVCQRLECWQGDRTNQTYCEVTLNSTAGGDLHCQWNNDMSYCSPSEGQFFGSGCFSFNNNSQSCFNTAFCQWNSTDNTCSEPQGGFTGGNAGYKNPSCSIVSDEGICGNISGCSYGGNTCAGNSEGIKCDYLNQSICTEFTLLSTCCSWNGTLCSQNFDPGCFKSKQEPPTGAKFCEDVEALNNETMCGRLGASPWYMPCKWNNETSKCKFNSGGFSGDFAKFDEIGSQSSCEAAGGVWKTQQFSFGGATKSDSWCEFSFGKNGNCDSQCWACESNLVAGTNTTAQAQTVCENSQLGYCSFFTDTNAPNGIGRCGPKLDFVGGGGKSCDQECSACDYLTSPESKCSTTFKGCIWLNDTNAPNKAGYCYGKNEKRCDTDCFSCYDSSNCINFGKGASNACTWDQSNYYCKPVGYTGEICFDGVDNDNNNKVDCKDSACATDKFCGGGDLNEQYGNCPSFNSNLTCIGANCIWRRDDFDQTYGNENSGFCDYPGSQCHDVVTPFECGLESDCRFSESSSGFCGENETQIDNCFSNLNQSGCETDQSCGWVIDQESVQGRCESLPFAQCFNNQTRTQSQFNCEANATVNGVSVKICNWNSRNNLFGMCEPLCFGLTADSCEQGTLGFCGNMSGFCEPKSFGGNCNQANGNQSWCTGDLFKTCTYTSDFNANNAANATEPSGFCNAKGESGFVGFMGESRPKEIGRDDDEVDVNDTWDIGDVAVKDDFDRMMIGIMLRERLESSAICNGFPLQQGLGSGIENHTFFWYLDTDDNTTNNCVSRDNVSEAGYEFSFKLSGVYTSLYQEIRSSFQCVNGSWGAVGIPLQTSQQKMCNGVGGGMAGIDKTELFKFKTLYNKTVSMRIYTSVSNETLNDSVVLDTAGPYYYSQGSFDFLFEDCSNTGGDADKDGFSASSDPDCFDFFKFGFVPNELGFQCNDNKDNDGDSKTDCSDEGCKYDRFACGGSLTPDATDKTAPKIRWLAVNTFPESALINYDTDEPSNGSIEFFLNDSSCNTLNTSVVDSGQFDLDLGAYKMFHDGPLDNYEFNRQRLGFELENGTTYYYKTAICDISSNCAVSACANFTTKDSIDNCKGCSTTFQFPFTAPSGSSATDPLGNLKFKFELPDGSQSDVDSNAEAGTQINHTLAKQFNIEISNPNATTAWKIKLLNASVSGKVSSSAQNFTGNSDIGFNSTNNGTFVGLGDDKCQELINIFRPKKIEIGLPGNVTQLWQCGSDLNNCTDKSANATMKEYNETTNLTLWEVPAEWGC